jgi:hypothetical protein
MSEICEGDLSDITFPIEEQGSTDQDIVDLIKNISPEKLNILRALVAKQPQQEVPVSRSPSPPKVVHQEKVIFVVKKSRTHCCARNKTNKKRCGNSAIDDTDFCAIHQSAERVFSRSDVIQKEVCGKNTSRNKPCQNPKESCPYHK